MIIFCNKKQVELLFQGVLIFRQKKSGFFFNDFLLIL